MFEGQGAARRPPRIPMARRSRKRWLAVAGVAALWAVLLYLTGSMVAGTALLLLLAALGGACWLSLRSLGIGRDHPWVQQMSTRPWRDGQEVLRLALRHLPDLFVTTPSGGLLAPNSVVVRLSQRDYDSLTGLMDTDLIGSSSAEVYQEQVAAHGARLASPGPVRVNVVADPSVLEGRYSLRLCSPSVGVPPSPHSGPLGFEPAGFGPGPAPVPVPGPARGPQFAHDGDTREGQARGAVAMAEAPTGAVTDSPTVAEWHAPPVPLLKLVTGDSVTQTRTSGARAGRGAVELVLPQVPTVSREHARFTFSEGQWWIANLGRNGLTLNGMPLAGEHPLRDGDTIRWGGKPDALQSQVTIG
jgi:hypothetical protein